MAADDHVIRSAPAARADEELPTFRPNIHKQPRSNKSLVYILATIVTLSIATLILGLTLLRINSPDIKLSAAQVKSFQHGTGSLNMAMVAELKIENTNFGRFMLHNSSTISVLYGDVIIGVANVNGGVVKARETKKMSVAIQVRANESQKSNTNFISSTDIGSGLLLLGSYTKLKGEVETIIKIIKRCRTAILSCTMTLNLTSHAFRELQCS